MSGSNYLRRISDDLWVTQDEFWEHGPSLYILSEENGPAKIGLAQQPARRVAALQGGNPRRLYVKAIFVGQRPACAYVEKHVLRNFRQYRLTGEWLSVPYSDIIREVEHFT